MASVLALDPVVVDVGRLLAQARHRWTPCQLIGAIVVIGVADVIIRDIDGPGAFYTQVHVESICMHSVVIRVLELRHMLHIIECLHDFAHAVHVARARQVMFFVRHVVKVTHIQLIVVKGFIVDHIIAEHVVGEAVFFHVVKVFLTVVIAVVLLFIVVFHNLDHMRGITIQILRICAQFTFRLVAVVLFHLHVLIVLQILAQMIRVIRALLHFARVHAQRGIAVKVRRPLVLGGLTMHHDLFFHVVVFFVVLLLGPLRALGACMCVTTSHFDRNTGQMLQWAQDAVEKGREGRHMDIKVRNRLRKKHHKVLFQHRLGHVQHYARVPRRSRVRSRPAR